MSQPQYELGWMLHTQCLLPVKCVLLASFLSVRVCSCQSLQTPFRPYEKEGSEQEGLDVKDVMGFFCVILTISLVFFMIIEEEVGSSLWCFALPMRCMRCFCSPCFPSPVNFCGYWKQVRFPYLE